MGEYLLSAINMLPFISFYAVGVLSLIIIRKSQLPTNKWSKKSLLTVGIFLAISSILGMANWIKLESKGYPQYGGTTTFFSALIFLIVMMFGASWTVIFIIGGMKKKLSWWKSAIAAFIICWLVCIVGGIIFVGGLGYSAPNLANTCGKIVGFPYDGNPLLFWTLIITPVVKLISWSVMKLKRISKDSTEQKK